MVKKIYVWKDIYFETNDRMIFNEWKETKS